MPTTWPDVGRSPRSALVNTCESACLTSESGLSSTKKKDLTDHCTRCTVISTEKGDMTGKELRRIRKRLGLTQATLAEQLAVTSTTVARWERDEVPIREPMARLIRLLAETKSKPKTKGRRR